jgi:hypothetical protein
MRERKERERFVRRLLLSLFVGVEVKRRRDLKFDISEECEEEEGERRVANSATDSKDRPGTI